MKPNLISAITLSAAIILQGCASTYRPVVDPTVSPKNYESDLVECRNFAGSDSVPVAITIIGGVIGAGIGILAVAGSGLNSNAIRNTGMAVGAITAGLGAAKEQRNVVARCMAGRGYSVLQ